MNDERCQDSCEVLRPPLCRSLGVDGVNGVNGVDGVNGVMVLEGSVCPPHRSYVDPV